MASGFSRTVGSVLQSASRAARAKRRIYNDVLMESLALVQARLGIAALKLAADTRMFAVEWVDEALHLAAVDALANSAKRPWSLVDHVSFLVMRQRGVTTAFAFDPDFRTAGFALFEA